MYPIPPDFLIDYQTLLENIKAIDPVPYAHTRNYLDGKVSYLSPFITHGVISTDQVARSVLEVHSAKNSEKFCQELAWREFFHRVWQEHEDDIFQDLRQEQEMVVSAEIPSVIKKADTGIDTIDLGIRLLYDTGYMHNHARMWTASLVCNIALTHWFQGAKWLYYHLLDGDLASNTLSWQWVAGSFSNKKYYANQDNLNKYSKHDQKNTYLDVSYEEIDQLTIPDEFEQRCALKLPCQLPESTIEELPSDQQPIFLRSIWNLDPYWKKDDEGHHILLIEPKHFQKWPINSKRWQFILHWAKQIEGCEILVKDFDELNIGDQQMIYFREYPAIHHWHGECEQRPFFYDNAEGYYKSFFAFWKVAQNKLDQVLL